MHTVAIDEPGKEVLLMGNEAIVRGAIEAGVQVCAGYPGNPSSEILGTLSKVGKELDIYVEWSVNEKVAMEVAAAGSIAGLRSMASMKQNGLNVASDFLLNLNLTDLRGALVLVVCDDPGAKSSTNEEDSRAFAKIGDLPLLEPTTFQEAKEMTRWAFELSEQVKIPVLLRSVTRISHARGNVTLDEIPREKRTAHFDTSKPILPFPVTDRHQALHNKLKQCEELFETSPFNKYIGPDEPDVLIVTCGSGLTYSREAIKNLQIEDRVGIVKLATTWPLPKRFLEKHLKKSQRILFVEEIDAFIEDSVKGFCAQSGGDLGGKTFLGKGSGTMPDVGEMTVDIVTESLQSLLDISFESRPADYATKAKKAAAELSPQRKMGFCPGCSHRASYWAIKHALTLDGRDGFVVGDIGCYTLGFGPSGFGQLKTLHAMGSGAGIASGLGQMHKFGFDQPILAICGDSTFFHSVIPALINAQYNNANFLMIIVDNSATAMTGFQPHAGTGTTALGEQSTKIDIEAVCKAIGARVETRDPYDLPGTTNMIYDLIQDKAGMKVLILKQMCTLHFLKTNKPQFDMSVNAEKCIGTDCGCNRLCTRVFKCPGLAWDSTTGKAIIDEAICTGCGVCADICPELAILAEEAKA